MPYCINCSKEIQIDWKLCPYCGKTNVLFPDIQVIVSNMVFVEGGSFLMGSYENKDERPIHQVTLDSFLISK